MSLNTTAATWVTGTVVTAAQLNTEVRDAINGIQAAWGAYTPVLTAFTTNPTLGNSTLTGSYLRIGKSVLGFRAILTIGSTFVAGSGAYFLTVPVAGVAGVTEVGIGTGVTIASGTRRVYVVDLTTTTTVLIVHGTNDTPLDNTGAGVAWASGHTVKISGTYEAA